jgi:FkbM family methyltransferase
MKRIKKIIFKLLGINLYLKLLHKGFRYAYWSGLLKKDYIYKYHYFDYHFIREGDHILDIGANLGYYTTLFSKWVGQKGKVYAVEPVTPFFKTLQWATKKCENVVLYNYALGAEEKETMLITPGRFGYLRTGLAHVSENKEGNKVAEFTFKASMKKASTLFISLPRLDFVKCDIEGYEEVVLPEMKAVLQKFKPPVQVETWGDHKSNTELFLTGIGYEMYGLDNAVLRPIVQLTDKRFGDFIFIHKDNKTILTRLGNPCGATYHCKKSMKEAKAE